MRARHAEPTLVRPGEPDEYGTWTFERLDGWLRTSVRREPVIVLHVEDVDRLQSFHGYLDHAFILGREDRYCPYH